MFHGPPPGSRFQYAKITPPKNIADVPRYLGELLGGFFTRMGYIFKLVWKTGPWILFAMLFFAIFQGVMPVVGSKISEAVLNELQSLLGITTLTDLRLVNRYDVEGLKKDVFERAVQTVFSEPQVDSTSAALPAGDYTVFAVESLPGQFDQRADSCAQCIQLMAGVDRPLVSNAKVYLLEGSLSSEKIKAVLEKYPTSIFMSGHIHNGFGNIRGVVRPFGAAVDIPAFKDGGNGYEVQIYSDCIVFRAINYVTGKYAPAYDMTIQTGDNNVENVFLIAVMVVALGVIVKSKRRRFE